MGQSKKNRAKNAALESKRWNYSDSFDRLVRTVRNRWYLTQHMTQSGCVIKSQVPPPRHCRDEKTDSPQLFRISGKRRGEYISEHHTAHNDGQYVVIKVDFSSCFWEQHLRISPELDLDSRTLWLNPFDSPQQVDITGTCSPSVVLYKTSLLGTTKLNYTFKDSNNSSTHMRFANAIVFEGKIYALSLQGSLVVMEVADNEIKITGLAANRAVPSKPSRHFREHFFVYKDEIFLVFLLSRKCVDMVEDVEVLRLDFSKLLWLKVEGLGQSSLFVEEDYRGGNVASKEFAFKSNCIYFNYNRTENWSVFEIETGLILPVQKVLDSN